MEIKKVKHSFQVTDRMSEIRTKAIDVIEALPTLNAIKGEERIELENALIKVFERYEASLEECYEIINMLIEEVELK